MKTFTTGTLAVLILTGYTSCAGTYYLQSLGGTSGCPPYPMDPYNGAYSVEQIGPEKYLIEDGAGSTLAGYSVMSSDSADSIDPNGTNTDSGGDTNYYWPTYNGYTFDTNSLWLEITNVSGGAAYLNAHNATNQVYAIWSTTNLVGGWNVESELWPTNSNVMPFTELTFDRQNLFLLAEDWTGVTENGNTVPDWWFWGYFGTIALYDTNIDSQGNTLLHDYNSGVNPNVINFTARLGNGHFNSTNAAGSFLVTTGVPGYESVLVNSSNLSTATWTRYDGAVSMNLGPTDGVYQVWIGLNGAGSFSVPTWIGTSVYLDRTPPVITITNPAPDIVMQPYIQVQGLANERLSTVSYDISNALGVVTNQSGAVTGEFLDTNLLAFTTNYFQCYDVQLTNGANLITVHAMDRAGNTTSTNLSYTLDYNDKTNPPTVTMTWPQGGEDIAQGSITVCGELSDPSAAIWLQVTDTNGDTNVIPGLVERDGHFWIQNVPLSAGTNWLSVTAQDVVSNTATMNLAVTENDSFGLAINPVSSDLWGVYSTVTGTISDSNYSVTVNGVAATNDAYGNWTAYNVPNNPGNMATFQVSASNSGGGGDPEAQLTVVKPAELTLEAATWRDESVNVKDDGIPIHEVTTWNFTAGNGGDWHDTWETVEGPPFSSFIGDVPILPDGSAPYLVLYNSDGSIAATNGYLGATPWQSTAQDVGSLKVVEGVLWEQRTGQASWQVHAGSLGVEGDIPNLITLYSWAFEEVPGTGFDNGTIVAGPDPSGPEITIAGEQEDTSFEAYLLMADGATQSSPITADRPLASVGNTAGASATKPTHLTECTAAANTNDTRTTIGIGETVAFLGWPMQTTWTLQGSGSLSANAGSSTDFTASHSPSTATITATIGTFTYPPFTFSVIAPTGVSGSVLTNVGLGTPGTNSIGAFTKFNLVIQPQTVSFNNNSFNEKDKPASVVIHWPNGSNEVYGIDYGNFGSISCNGVFADNIRDGPRPIANLFNGSTYGSCSFTVNWTDQYRNESSNWVDFAPMQTTTTFNANGSTVQTYQGASGNPQGPWQ